MLTRQPAPDAELSPTLAAAVMPGSDEYVPFVRQWVGALTAIAGCPSGELELAAAELFTNAVRHSRSGHAGGEVTVIVATGPGGAVIHVHDQGADDGQVPYVKVQRAAGLRENGRGLRIVKAISVHWAVRPAACCPQAPPDDPAVTADGCCVWCHIRPGPAPATVGAAIACKVAQPRRGSGAQDAQACCSPLLTWNDTGVSLAATSLCIRQPGRRIQIRQLIAHAVRADAGDPSGRPPRPCGGGGGARPIRASHRFPAGRP